MDCSGVADNSRVTDKDGTVISGAVGGGGDRYREGSKCTADKSLFTDKDNADSVINETTGSLSPLTRGEWL